MSRPILNEGYLWPTREHAKVAMKLGLTTCMVKEDIHDLIRGFQVPRCNVQVSAAFTNEKKFACFTHLYRNFNMFCLMDTQIPSGPVLVKMSMESTLYHHM